jgi:hypothetical protein
VETEQHATDRRRRIPARAVAAVWAVVAATAACGGQPRPADGAPTSASAPSALTSPAPEVGEPGDIPDNQVFVPFTAPGGVVVSVPEGWARSADGAATVFTDKYNSVRLEVAARSAPADVAAAPDTEVSQLRSTVPGFALVDLRTVQRKAGEALLVAYEANSRANAVTGKSIRESVERYAFWNDGREAVLTLSGAKGADNVDPWRTISDSLRWA